MKSRPPRAAVETYFVHSTILVGGYVETSVHSVVYRRRHSHRGRRRTYYKNVHGISAGTRFPCTEKHSLMDWWRRQRPFCHEYEDLFMRKKSRLPSVAVGTDFTYDTKAWLEEGRGPYQIRRCITCWILIRDREAILGLDGIAGLRDCGIAGLRDCCTAFQTSMI
jgi:hypothetical protein